MTLDFLLALAAALVLLAGSFAALRQPLPPDARFWGLIGAALAGTAAASATGLGATGFSMASAL